VAFGAIALVIALKKTAAAGMPFVILVGLEKTGPKPSAVWTAQAKRAIPKIGIKMIWKSCFSRSFVAEKADKL
jgi:hypothetical protein